MQHRFTIVVNGGCRNGLAWCLGWVKVRVADLGVGEYIWNVVGQIGPFGKESIMSKDARNKDVELSPEEREQFEVVVALLAKCGFGGDGPPRETTFAQIEQFGHQTGQMVARAVDAHLAEQHAKHFVGEAPCPTCGEQQPHDLPLQTSDGEVTLHEPTCRCSTCRRDFFPSAFTATD